jgi:L-ascorbate metabolism protein UlaG (beta-lactamase superfamily)
MIKPVLAGNAFLADVAVAKTLADALHVWWLGQSGFLVQWHGRHLLLDPYLSDSLTLKYTATDKPHVRMTERVIEPERLAFIDIVACTHNHTDHFDPDTLRRLSAANPNLMLIVPEANRLVSAERLGVSAERFTGIDEEQTIEAAGFKLTAVPAAHETIERDEQGWLRFVGYLIHTTTQTIYHAGDTVLYDGMAEAIVSRSCGAIDVALLPINGRDPARGVPGNMNGREAASLAHQIGARLAIPCHYEMFEFNKASPDEFVAECERLEQKYSILRNGERWSGM